jgi:hypothetical protein
MKIVFDDEPEMTREQLRESQAPGARQRDRLAEVLIAACVRVCCHRQCRRLACESGRVCT